jgi:hypothetical protein
MAYDKLALCPAIVARTVCGQSYTGPAYRDKVEARRKKMTEGEIRRFVEFCDERCRNAYRTKTEWFMKCVRSDRGNETLSIWLSHWLAGYLLNL